jgi:hypothetical protein
VSYDCVEFHAVLRALPESEFRLPESEFREHVLVQGIQEDGVVKKTGRTNHS